MRPNPKAQAEKGRRKLKVGHSSHFSYKKISGSLTMLVPTKIFIIVIYDL